MPLIVSDLIIYPIKGCRGVHLQSSRVEQRGLLYDRRWMLVNANNQFISQRECAHLALLQVYPGEQGLNVKYSGTANRCQIPYLTQNEINDSGRVDVTVWDDTCPAIMYSDNINEWFSETLGLECRLVYMPDDTKRQIDLKYAQPGELNSFSDGYPILLLGQASFDFLNQKLQMPITMNRFRPNIVFIGGTTHLEDEINKFEINDAAFEGVKPCARCKVPNIDQETGISGNEPTATLSTYRLWNKKILFGQNVIVKKEGFISVGTERIPNS